MNTPQTSHKYAFEMLVNYDLIDGFSLCSQPPKRFPRVCYPIRNEAHALCRTPRDPDCPDCH